MTFAQLMVCLAQNLHQPSGGQGAACHRHEVAAEPVRKLFEGIMTDHATAEQAFRKAQYVSPSATMRDAYERDLNRQAVEILEAAMKKTGKKKGGSGRKC